MGKIDTQSGSQILKFRGRGKIKWIELKQHNCTHELTIVSWTALLAGEVITVPRIPVPISVVGIPWVEFRVWGVLLSWRSVSWWPVSVWTVPVVPVSRIVRTLLVRAIPGIWKTAATTKKPALDPDLGFMYMLTRK